MSEEMTIVAVRTDVVEKMVEMERKYAALDAKEKAEPKNVVASFHASYALGEITGFMDALKFFMPTESVGLMIYQRDDILEGDGSDD